MGTNIIPDNSFKTVQSQPAYYISEDRMGEPYFQIPFVDISGEKNVYMTNLFRKFSETQSDIIKVIYPSDEIEPIQERLRKVYDENEHVCFVLNVNHPIIRLHPENLFTNIFWDEVIAGIERALTVEI
jgi:hypothetical protein